MQWAEYAYFGGGLELSCWFPPDYILGLSSRSEFETQASVGISDREIQEEIEWLEKRLPI